MSRTQFPVVAAFALTINKAQGLTIREGVVIHLAGSKRYRPAGMHGLSFVAFTRSESFDMTAFKNLPAFEEFRRGRDSPMLRMRQKFMEKLKQMHTTTLAAHSTMKTEEDEAQAHAEWDAQQAKKPPRRTQEGPLRRCPHCAEP